MTTQVLQVGRIRITVEVADIAPPVQETSRISQAWINRFLSEVPEGFDTVLGYLARNNPEALFLMGPDAEATARDGFWLTHRCKQRGIKPVKVEACAHLIEQGIFVVNAYPISLLEERLG